MAQPNHDSALRVADLFRMRNADRLGLTISDADRTRDAELNTFGESLGIAPRGENSATPAMPGKPVTSGPDVPSGDALGGMAPAGGGQPTGQTDAMQARSSPATPSAAASGDGMKRSGIPALDALSEMPRKRSRGMYHNRKLGRVLGGGS